MELCGKLAIIRAILQAEAESRLAAKEDGYNRFDTKLTDSTWFQLFFRKLSQDVHRLNIARIASDVSFIIFNYDRCLERYLAQEIEDYYRIGSHAAQDLVSRIDIVHPYGSIGPLPWHDNRDGGVHFGEREPANLLALAPRIKTFTQGMEEGAERTKLKLMVQQAEAIVFLGFSYQDQNIKLLAPDVDDMRSKTIFGTTLGISPMDQLLIHGELQRMFGSNNQPVRGIHLHPVTCHQYFCDYWRHLGAGE